MVSEAVAFIRESETIPEKLIVGVEAILSEKVAVIVTTLEFETISSESVSVKVTVGAVLSIIKVILSVPEYVLPDKFEPETVAVVEVTVAPDTVQIYSQTEAEAVALINTLEIMPLKLIVGVGVMDSEKVAVMVTTSELEIILSLSELLKVTEGVELLETRYKIPFLAIPLEAFPMTDCPTL